MTADSMITLPLKSSELGNISLQRTNETREKSQTNIYIETHWHKCFDLVFVRAGACVDRCIFTVHTVAHTLYWNFSILLKKNILYSVWHRFNQFQYLIMFHAVQNKKWRNLRPRNLNIASKIHREKTYRTSNKRARIDVKKKRQQQLRNKT